MTKNLAALQKALNAQAQPRAQVGAGSESPVQLPSPGSYLAPSRAGKINITAYLSPDYKSSLRLIQARTGHSLQTLVAEALNDLFQKYDVPTIRGE
jgi:hypothetical protein